MTPTLAAAVVTSQPTYAEPDYGTFSIDFSQPRPLHEASRSPSAESHDTFGVSKKRKRSASLAVLTSPLSTPLSEEPPQAGLVVRHARSVPGIDSPIVSRFSSVTDLTHASAGEANVGCFAALRGLLRDFWRGMWSCGG